MKDRRSFIATGLSVGMTTVAGCSALLDDDPPVEALEMNISDVRSPDVGLTSATIPVIFEVKNTHEEDRIPTPVIDYNALINGEETVSSREDVPSLGPQDSTTEEFELIAAYGDIGNAIADAIENDQFRVTITGTMKSEGAETSFESSHTY